MTDFLFEEEARISTPISLSQTSSARSSDHDTHLNQLQVDLGEKIFSDGSDGEVSSPSSEGSQLDLQNLLGSHRANHNDLFASLSSSVVKICDPEFLQLPRAEVIKILASSWPKLPVGSQMEVCKKSGINPINFEKNKQAIDSGNLDGFKDSKLQKIAYLAKLFLKAEDCKQQLVQVDEALVARQALATIEHQIEEIEKEPLHLDSPYSSQSEPEEGKEAKMIEQSHLEFSHLASKKRIIDVMESSEEEDERRHDSGRTASYFSESEMSLDQSEYNVRRKRQVKKLSKILAKEMIQRANKKAMQLILIQEAQEQAARARDAANQIGGRSRGPRAEAMDNFDLTWVAKSERFKSYNRQKQMLTINRKTEYEIQDYHRQELERYADASKPYEYRSGKHTYIVGPTYRKRAQQRSMAKPHPLLISKRPGQVSLLSVVRDAVARLPDAVGTKLDVAELCKDSQWFCQGSMDDVQMTTAIGGGLDRLQAEDDPCCHFDMTTKLWVYLHAKRRLDDPRMNPALKPRGRPQPQHEDNFESKQRFQTGSNRFTPAKSNVYGEINNPEIGIYG